MASADDATPLYSWGCHAHASTHSNDLLVLAEPTNAPSTSASPASNNVDEKVKIVVPITIIGGVMLLVFVIWINKKRSGRSLLEPKQDGEGGRVAGSSSPTPPPTDRAGEGDSSSQDNRGDQHCPQNQRSAAGNTFRDRTVIIQGDIHYYQPTR